MNFDEEYVANILEKLWIRSKQFWRNRVDNSAQACCRAFLEPKPVARPSLMALQCNLKTLATKDFTPNSKDK